jgi:hypothetical protein
MPSAARLRERGWFRKPSAPSAPPASPADLFGDLLHARRHVHVKLHKLILGRAHGPAEQSGESRRRHAEARAIIDVGLIEAETAVGLKSMMWSRIVPA